nr:chitobiase/beta-hexosaminidase C-terminal domain-containing protein [Bacteroidales bacterium]
YEGYTEITLTSDKADSIFFSFAGSESTATSQLYTEPIILKEPATITAFANGEKLFMSEIVSQYCPVYGIPAVKDTIAHFTSNQEDWFTNAVIYNSAMEVQETPTSNWSEKAAYYWDKYAWSCYSTTEVDHTETVYEEDGVTPVKSLVNPEQDSIKTVYKLDPAAVKYVYSTSDTQWRLRSQGQVFTGETNADALTGVGNGAKGYYAETALDGIGLPSKGKLTYGGKASGESYTGSVESTVKFEGELDIVTYLTNGGTSTIILELQTSADGETWATVDTLSSAGTQRYYKKNRFHISATEPVYVRVAQTGGGSKGQLYDIYVIQTEGTTGIEAISAKESVVADDRIFDLMGRRVNSKVAGQLYIQNGKKVVVR